MPNKVADGIKHAEIKWNPDLQEWFRILCPRPSDRIARNDGEGELEFARMN